MLSSTSLLHSLHLQEVSADTTEADADDVLLKSMAVTSTQRRPSSKTSRSSAPATACYVWCSTPQHTIIYNPSTRHVQQVPSPHEAVLGTLLNGALHWTVRRGNNISPADGDDHDPRPFGIVAFDLTEETYKEVPLPCDGDKHFSFYGLGVLGGCLSMLHSPHGSDYQVWVMKEYGIKASWSVFTTIPQKMEDSREYMGLMSLLCVLNKGEILMMLHNHNKVVIYSPGHRKFRTIFNGEIGSSQLALYLETLVSPKIYAPSSLPCIQAT
ncbi:hypothetical protein M0R45_008290 [Rubus argutus]|uniref:F-box associated beta-propeller type 1 domain-containing protein n=1 Tax=Rubus argutus TaxID=59490 RepID=A0AAW1Y1R7_RUBAR